MFVEVPEHRRGWRAILQCGSAEIAVEAEHVTRRRPATPHEHVRSMARGRPAAMVEEVEHRWVVRHARDTVCRLIQDRGGGFRSDRSHEHLGRDGPSGGPGGPCP